MKHPCLALSLALAAVSLAPNGARAAASPTPQDPANAAIEIAMMIGEVQALAEICSPPADTYQPVLDQATRALDALYSHAGLDPGEIEADIDEGRQDETRRHDDISYPLDCDLFPKQVAAIEDHVQKARNQQAMPTASDSDQ
jgi:hypothetical protein